MPRTPSRKRWSWLRRRHALVRRSATMRERTDQGAHSVIRTGRTIRTSRRTLYRQLRLDGAARPGTGRLHMRRLNRALTALGAVLMVLAVVAMVGPAVPGARAADWKDAANEATPKANCGPGSNPETSAQGRVPAADVASGRAQKGYTCNLAELSHFGDRGGYKVHRYVDGAGHECAYYDSTLLFPTNVATNGTNLTGVYVLDMKDPAHPVKTDNLLTPAMQSPHESLNINVKRGLLVADMGFPTFNPGFVDIYDISQDCRHPVLKSSSPLGILGHESGFSPDGNTFWVSSTGGSTLTALDITDPTSPQILWVRRGGSPHGERVSADGNRLYIADTQSGLQILDVSDIQARKPNAEGREISHLDWPDMSIPQVPIPVTIKGHPYLVEIDEFAKGTKSDDPESPVGAARIIDIGDDTKPVVVSNIRLEVNTPKARTGDQMNDPEATSALQGYAGHYCAVPQENEPGIVACSFILSGLRVFDIRDPKHPKEIAYFNKPTNAGVGGQPSTFAMSAPTFVPERSEIWWLDGNSGFYALRFTNGVWPFGGATVKAASASQSAAAAAAAPAAGAGSSTLPATGAPAGLLGSGFLVLGLALIVRRLKPRS